MKFIKIVIYVPLLVLVIAIIYCLYVVATTSIMLTEKHYWGIGFVVMALVATLFNSKLGKYLTAITLLIGVVNLIAFTPVIEAYSFGFSLNDVGINVRIQSFSFLVLLLFLAINYRGIISFFRKGANK
jgi:hypothetical protein